jgi:hypothetical protein
MAKAKKAERARLVGIVDPSGRLMQETIFRKGDSWEAWYEVIERDRVAQAALRGVGYDWRRNTGRQLSKALTRMGYRKVDVLGVIADAR